MLAQLADIGRLNPTRREPTFPHPPAPGSTADLLIVGDVRTMDPSRPTAEAIAVRDGWVVGVGSRAELDGLVDPGTKMLDVSGGTTLPGFVEPHMHYWMSAMLDGWVDCSTRNGTTFGEILDRLRAAGPVADDWTLGQLCDPSLVDGHLELTRDLLDEVVPDRPAMVVNASGHFVYVNSIALERAGIHEDVVDPPDGFFVRDHDGRLTGALGENGAIAPMLRVVPRKTQGQVVDSLVAINQRAAAMGITRTHDAGSGLLFGGQEHELLHAAVERGARRMSYAVLDAAADRVIVDGGLVPFAGDDDVRALSWKFVSDGSNQGYSGYQYDDYLGRDDHGHPNYELDELVGRMAEAVGRGWQVMAHANGDAAIGQVIDAYRQVLTDGAGGPGRHRIEHCSFATHAQLAAMAELGVSPSFLANHVYYWGRAFRDEIVGPEKADRLDPFAGALRHGLRFSMHCDYRVTEFEPLRMVQTAVTRRMRHGGEVLNPAECVSVDQAMRAITVDAAWQLHADDRMGSIAVGRYADLAVLDADPFAVDPEGIADIGVLRTLVGGEER